MRLKPRIWFLVSVLLFAAAFFTWRHAEKYQARREAAARSSVPQMQKPPLIKTAATNSPAKNKTYRLSNTTQTITQLLHNGHALILRNALIDTEIPVGLKIPAHLRAKG